MRFIGSLRFRPWSESTEAYASKIGPKARTAEPFGSCGAFKALDAEGKVRLAHGGSESKVLWPDSDPGPNLMNLK